MEEEGAGGRWRDHLQHGCTAVVGRRSPDVGLRTSVSGRRTSAYVQHGWYAPTSSPSDRRARAARSPPPLSIRTRSRHTVSARQAIAARVGDGGGGLQYKPCSTDVQTASVYVSRYALAWLYHIDLTRACSFASHAGSATGPVRFTRSPSGGMAAYASMVKASSNPWGYTSTRLTKHASQSSFTGSWMPTSSLTEHLYSYMVDESSTELVFRHGGRRHTVGTAGVPPGELSHAAWEAIGHGEGVLEDLANNVDYLVGTERWIGGDARLRNFPC